MRLWGTAVALAFVATIGTQSANAATIDVDNLLEGTPHGGGIGGSVHYSPAQGMQPLQGYQTWTVGKAGRLDRVDIFGSALRILSTDGQTFPTDTDFRVTLTILSGGVEWYPGQVELGSVTRAASELGGGANATSSFDLSGLGIFAAQGDLLTFRMSVEQCPQVAFCLASWSSWHTMDDGATTNDYEGGRAFISTLAGMYHTDYDVNFRTWVSAVPEPSTWAMMIFGFGAAGVAMRANHRQRRLDRLLNKAGLGALTSWSGPVVSVWIRS